MKWGSHYLAKGERFNQLWRDLATDSSRKVLYILGLGFDPRCLSGLISIQQSGAIPARCMVVEYGSGRPNRNDALLARAQKNRTKLMDIIDADSLSHVDIQTLSEDDRYVGGRRIVESFNSLSLYSEYTDVVVDISALPPALYFPLIKSLLQLSTTAFQNLHVVVSDAPSVDYSIVAEGGERAELVIGFEGGTDRVATPEPRPVWAPVLGERAHSQLRSIASYKDWTLIHPILPFPSRNPRRGDQIVASYNNLLFDEWRIEPEDFIYADEQNPFDVYQALVNLADSARASLNAIGTAQIIVSCHSSKLLSLGVLLAAFEKSLGVAQVQPTDYVLATTVPMYVGGELYDVWLTGEPYATN